MEISARNKDITLPADVFAAFKRMIHTLGERSYRKFAVGWVPTRERG